MARVHILAVDRIKDSTLSGGSWVSTLPLSNFANQQPKKLARSTNAAAASTVFVADMGRVVPISMLALINHNLSVNSLVRFRLSESPGLASPAIDVTVAGLATNVVWGSQPWGAYPWTGVDSSQIPPGGWVTFYKHATTPFGRYVGVDITDTSNPDGYVQAGVFMAGQAFVPDVNMAYGAQLVFVDPSTQSRTVGGQKYSDVKPRYRTFSAALEVLDQSEAMGSVWDLQRLLGISGGLLLVYDPDDGASVLLRRTIYGTLSSLSPIVTARAGADKIYSTQIQIEELI